MIHISIQIDGNEVTVNQSEAKPTKVVKKHNRHHSQKNVSKPTTKQPMYAVMYDNDEQTFLHSMHLSAREANEALARCAKENEEFYGCNRTTEYIMTQNNGKIVRVLEVFDWESFEKGVK